MQLKQLSDEALDQSLLAFVKKEKEVLKEILLHIAEVDKRRLYLRMAYPSLFAYLTEHIGYAAGSAQRRLDAARLSQEVPSVIEDLEAGHINLSQVTLLQKAFRDHKRRLTKQIGLDNNQPELGEVKNQPDLDGKLVSSTESSMTPMEAKMALKESKAQLLTDLKHKSFTESQVLVAKALQIEIKENTKVHYQSDESVRLEVALTKAQWKKLQEMRCILSNSLPSGSWDQAFEYVADLVLEQKSSLSKPRRKRSPSQKPNTSRSAISNAIQSTTSSVTPSAISIPEHEIPVSKLKQMALLRDQCCQYKDPKTGKVCSTRWYLESDHFQPRWAGGKDEIKNYRALCSNHNKEVYRQQANIRRV